MKRDIQMSTVEQQEISIDENEVQFAKKLDKYTDLLNRLLDVLRQQGMETPKEQHDHLSEFASKEMNEDSSFLHMKTWKKWISGSSKSEKRKNHPAWNVVEEFLSRFEKDDDKNDNATGIEMTELGHELPDIGCDNIPSTNTTPMKVDDSGDAVMASNENNITVGDVLRVMSNDPPSLVSVTFIDTVQKYRESWSLLVNPENTFIPKRVLHTIDKFCKKCLSDSKFADLWTCETDYIYKACQLRNVELAGVPAYSGSKACLFVDGRKFVEKNIPTSEPCWFNRSSVALEVGTVDDIFARVFAKVPKELIPEKGETKATMIDKIAGSYWLDVIFNKFNNISGSLNEWEGSMQPVRRTLGVVKRRAHIYRSDLAPGEEEGDGRHVISLYCYPNTECPTNKWMCRPLTNMDYAQMITVWAYMWSYGTEETRKSPPNGIQQLMYHKVLNKKMGFHRDNFKNNVMTNLENGTVPWGDHPTVGGSGNSQIHGTSVIVFTRGNCPMKMIFKYPSLNGSATQEKKWYVTSPSFQMKMDDGWITVLDPVDDMLMLHSVEFEEDDGNEEHFRIAWVYRYLKVVHDFYVDSCTIRRDKQMMNTVERKDDWDSAKMQRDIFM
jgi:hypothetical protein